MIIIIVKIPKHQRLKEKILISKPALNYQILRLPSCSPYKALGGGWEGKARLWGSGHILSNQTIKKSLLMSVLFLSPPKSAPPPEGQVYHVLVLSCLGGQSRQPIKPGGRGNGELRTHPLPPRTCFPTTSNSEITTSTSHLGDWPISSDTEAWSWRPASHSGHPPVVPWAGGGLVPAASTAPGPVS